MKANIDALQRELAALRETLARVLQGARESSPRRKVHRDATRRFGRPAPRTSRHAFHQRESRAQATGCPPIAAA
jgi:hypothetical protein